MRWLRAVLALLFVVALGAAAWWFLAGDALLFGLSAAVCAASWIGLDLAAQLGNETD